MPKYSLNFRSTAGSWGETGDNGAILGDAYPVTRGNLVCGWVGGSVTAANYAGATDAKLSGRNNHNTGAIYFRIDLPNGPGTYRIWVAGGALSSTLNTGFIIRDGSGGAAISTVPSTSVIGNASAASSNVLDATGAIVTYPNYLSTGGGTYVEFTAVNDHIRIERNGISVYLNNIQLEPQSTPLVDAVLSKEDGTGTHAGTIWAKEPQGKRIGRISAAVGTQSFAVIAGGTYFTTAVEGSTTYLVTTGTRIPDGWSGTVTVRQTSGADTRDTNFVLTATAITRPTTGILGLVSSETLNRRGIVKAVVDAEKWAGYEGQSFASDQVATSGSDLTTKFNAITPDGTSWYRIRLQNGTYTGNQNLSAKNFGTGGCLIEPDTGHDPEVRCKFKQIENLRKVHFRGLKLITDYDETPGQAATQALFNGTMGSAGTYAILRFSGNRIGKFYGSEGIVKANYRTWGYFLYIEFCEQIVFEDNDYNGIYIDSIICGGRLFVAKDNRYQNVVGDFHAWSSAFRFNTPRGVFANDWTYMWLEGETIWNNPDVYAIFGEAPHADYLQIRRTGGAAYPTTTAGVNGSATSPWTVGVIGFNAADGASGRLYTVTAATGDGLINPASPPTGTGTGIVSGNVTFSYLSEYTMATTVLIHIENAGILSDGTTTDGAGVPAQPNIQFLINSNSGWNNTHIVSAINNISASSNIRGLTGSDATVHAECNTFVGGATKALDNDQAEITGATVRARRNIVGVVGGLPDVVGVSSTTSEGNVGVNWQEGAAVGTRPGDVLAGAITPFVDPGTIGWSYPGFVDDGSINAATFRSNLSRQLHHLTGIAGAKLREVHTVTLSGTGGPQDFELVIAP